MEMTKFFLFVYGAHYLVAYKLGYHVLFLRKTERIDLAVCRVAGFLFLENAFYAVKDSIPPCAFLMIFQIVIEICFYFVVLSLHHDGEHACLKVNRSYEVGIEFGKYGIGRVVCAAEVYAE